MDEKTTLTKAVIGALKELPYMLAGTSAFPILTGAAKLLPWHICDFAESGQSISAVVGYLTISGIVDIAESLYRSHKLDSFLDERNYFSCFEKHVFYDAPRGLYKLLSKNFEPTTASENTQD